MVLQLGNLIEVTPGIRLQQMSTLGRTYQDLFFWTATGRTHVLGVSGRGTHHDWQTLPDGWDNHAFANAPPAHLGSFQPGQPLPPSVTHLTTAQKVGQAMYRSLNYVGEEAKPILLGLISPQAIGYLLAMEALYTVSLFFGVGEVVTLVLVVAGVYFVGHTVIDIIESLVAFVKTATAAKTTDDLEVAAKHFAHAMTLGVDIVVGLLLRKMRRPTKPGILRAKAMGGGGKRPTGGTAKAGTPAGASSRPGKLGSGSPAPTAPKPKGVPRRKRKNSTKTRPQRAKTNTDNMDSRRGGHSKGKHGTQVSPKDHEDRLRTGRDPATGKIPVDKKGKPNKPPRKSSGFDNDEKHLEALGKADDKLNKGMADGSIKPKADGSYEVKVDVKDAGTSYSLNPPTDRATGKVVTSKVNQATAIYRIDPITGKPKLVTLFPGP